MPEMRLSSGNERATPSRENHGKIKDGFDDKGE